MTKREPNTSTRNRFREGVQGSQTPTTERNPDADADERAVPGVYFGEGKKE